MELLFAQLLVLFFGIGLHEYAHCKFADMAGDPTPSYYGRVTLNLFKHFELVGTVLMVVTMLNGYGIGWGRPAPIDPSKMKNPRWDTFIAVAAGPISNLLQAILYAIVTRLAIQTHILATISDNGVRMFVVYFLIFGVMINCGLFFFNLIPFGPLDGHWLVGLLLPEKQRVAWFRFNRTIGFAGLIAVVLVLRFAHISLTQGPVLWAYNILVGPTRHS